VLQAEKSIIHSVLQDKALLSFFQPAMNLWTIAFLKLETAQTRVKHPSATMDITVCFWFFRTTLLLSILRPTAAAITLSLL
jgi:hypothetical protein